MTLYPYPTKTLDGFDAWNTTTVWPNIETWEVPYRVRGARTWEVAYCAPGDPEFSETTSIGTIQLLPNNIYEGETPNGSRYCESLEDAELFVIMAWAGDWRPVSRGDVPSPIRKVA